MCGFVGFYSKTAIPSLLLEEMAQSIAHRGPDDEGFFGVSTSGKGVDWKTRTSGPSEITLGLGFRRLAIIDLSPLGAQPMASQDSRYRICFNGEIYNYLELKEQLAGFRFRSQSDTEVLLELFARHRTDTLSKLNGIFAFAIYDTLTRKLWLARDQFGIKPVYYFKDERGIFFASEIRALLKAKREKPALRHSLTARYLMNGWVPDPDTLFQGIQKLEPGHFLSIGADLSVSSTKYWDLSFSPENTPSLSDWVEQLDSIMKGAVERQLRSDVPVAFFLSGGVDSSLLAAKAIQVQKNIPTTYTVGFKWAGSKGDFLDLESARVMKEKFRFNHNEIILEPSIVSLLPKIVATLEEPISDAAAICSYLICETAAKGFKVLISGQGGDELFAGYPIYRAGMAAHRIQKVPNALLSALHQASQALPYSVGGKRFQTVHRLRKILRSAQESGPVPFALLRSPFGLEALESLLVPSLAEAQADPFGIQERLFANAKGWDSLSQELYLDTKTYLPCLNLNYTDKTSMAHSVEVRVPLLDMEIAALVERVPSKFKMSMSESKVLLKALADKVLPREIVHRPKAGFGLPLKDWFLNDLQPMARELLSPERLTKQGLFRPEPVQKWLSEHHDRIADHSTKIYSLMTFQLWCEHYEIAG